MTPMESQILIGMCPDHGPFVAAESPEAERGYCPELVDYNEQCLFEDPAPRLYLPAE